MTDTTDDAARARWLTTRDALVPVLTDTSRIGETEAVCMTLLFGTLRTDHPLADDRPWPTIGDLTAADLLARADDAEPGSYEEAAAAWLATGCRGGETLGQHRALLEWGDDDENPDAYRSLG